MKKVLIIIILIFISGCMFNKKQEEPTPAATDEKITGNHTIGVYFSSVDAIEVAIKKFEEQTGGKLISSRPEYNYYVFSYEQKTEDEMKEIQDQAKELDYVKDTDEYDSEFEEPDANEVNDEEQDETLGDWTLPEY